MVHGSPPLPQSPFAPSLSITLYTIYYQIAYNMEPESSSYPPALPAERQPPVLIDPSAAKVAKRSPATSPRYRRLIELPWVPHRREVRGNRGQDLSGGASSGSGTCESASPPRFCCTQRLGRIKHLFAFICDFRK
jgi:hypothetical protein